MDWSDKVLAAHLINRLARNISDTPFEGAEPDKVLESYRLPVLVNANLRFPRDFPHIDRIRIVHRAIADCEKSGYVDRDLLLRIISELVSEYETQKWAKYFLYTQLNAQLSDPLMSQILPKGMELLADFSALVTSERSDFKHQVKGALGTVTWPSNYLVCQLASWGKSPYHAAERGIRTLNGWRGLLTFALMHHRETITSGAANPMAIVATGPLHTIHTETGKSACSAFWYEYSYRMPIRLLSLEREQNSFVDYFRHWQSLIEGSLEEEWLWGCLERYANAFDDSNPPSVFTKFWAILEELTGTSIHRIVIERTSARFKNREEQKAQLELLREVRNELIHNDRLNVPLDRLTWLLKGYVDSLFRFHLESSLKGVSRKVRFEYLDLLRNSHLLVDHTKLVENFEVALSQLAIPFSPSEKVVK